MRAAVPAIYFMMTGGTKIAVPQEASEYSAVVRRALNSWAETYGPPQPLPDEDEDDPCTNSDSARPHDDFADDEGNSTRSIFGDEEDNENYDNEEANANEDENDNGNEDDNGTCSPAPSPSGERDRSEEKRGGDKERGSEEASPRGYHQRTPCMVGDDPNDGDEDGLLALSTGSAGELSLLGTTQRVRAESTDTASAWRRGGHCAAIGSSHAAEDAAAAALLQHHIARISDAEIVIELQSAEKAEEEEQSNENINNSSSSSSGVQRRPLISMAVELCVGYLFHFAREAEMGRQPPAAIPAPLDRPLVAFLSVWEIDFLYCAILGLSTEQRDVAESILKRCPDMDFLHPTPYLRRPGVRAALVADIPEAEHVALLMGVMHAAEVLQIASLQALCVSWCADYIVRASYSSVDPMQSAALVRRCFSVKSDWSKKEMDCLRLENEWPADEEE